MTLTDIAIQNLRRRKGKTAFLLLTFILVIGITVTLNTLAKSMQDDLQKSLTQYGANVVITPKSEHFNSATAASPSPVLIMKSNV